MEVLMQKENKKDDNFNAEEWLKKHKESIDRLKRVSESSEEELEDMKYSYEDDDDDEDDEY